MKVFGDRAVTIQLSPEEADSLKKALVDSVKRTRKDRFDLRERNRFTTNESVYSVRDGVIKQMSEHIEIMNSLENHMNRVHLRKNDFKWLEFEDEVDDGTHDLVGEINGSYTVDVVSHVNGKWTVYWHSLKGKRFFNGFPARSEAKLFVESNVDMMLEGELGSPSR